MTYLTQGVVTFHAAENKISINPTANYQVTHDKKSYTCFVKTGRKRKSKIFATKKRFKIRKRLKSQLIKAAFSKVCLRIAICDGFKVSDVIIPASS
jgi:hypothetical protein